MDQRTITDWQYLDSFRKYEQKLTDLDWVDEGQGDEDQLIARRVLCFPGHVDASFLKELSSICSPDTATDLFPGTELEQHLDFIAASGNTRLTTQPCNFLTGGTDLLDYTMEDLSWMETEWASTGGVAENTSWAPIGPDFKVF